MVTKLKKRLREGKPKVNKAIKRKKVTQEAESSSGEEEDFEIPENDYEAEEKKKVELAHQADSDADEEGHDSDRELQIALRDGLLKTDRLNYVVEKKRPIINKAAEIREKITQFGKKLPWIETLDVTTESTITKQMINDDFEREMQFYKQAEKAVHMAVPRLLGMGVKILRPADYYAEMAKSDGHMQKVRKRLLHIQEGKERQEAIRRMREEKKYATKVQKEAVSARNTEKKQLMEAVKKHKKGMKQQLEDMLNNVKKLGLDHDDDGKMPSGISKKLGGNRSKDHKTEFKSQKFGYGGRKKGMKRNDKTSFEDIGAGPGRHGGVAAGGGGGFRGRGGGRGGFGGGGRGRGGGGGRGRGGGGRGRRH